MLFQKMKPKLDTPKKLWDNLSKESRLELLKKIHKANDWGPIDRSDPKVGVWFDQLFLPYRLNIALQFYNTHKEEFSDSIDGWLRDVISTESSFYAQ